MKIAEVKELLWSKLKETEWRNYFDYVWMEGLRIKAFSLLKPKEKMQVLEIGCGDGWFCIENALAFPFVEFVGIDLFEAEEAEENLKFFDLNNCKFISGDVFAVKLPQ